MKLRNKKTGMIGEAGYTSTSDGTIIVNNINDQDEWYEYNSLAELNEEWEDMLEEEPKVGFIIDPFSEEYLSRDDDCFDEYDIERAKELGTWFETKEEAEKAVEKLKAWKRLKDKGFKFILSTVSMDRIDIARECFDNIEQAAEAKEDLNICFGGEE